MNNLARLIAFYLPQYYPIPENDLFWGKGFTEWTNVTKAKPLFIGHKQPQLPGELGFYDLRVPEVREQQATLAQAHGVEGFCYWHYWFGKGKRVLERVFNEVLESGKPDFPFCLGWANESWTGKWHGLDNEIIFKQTYPGEKDFKEHFFTVLPAFKDKRYLKVNDKPLFLVYRPKLIEPKASFFTQKWNKLAIENGLKGIHFIGVANNWNPIQNGFDAFVSNAPTWVNQNLTFKGKIYKTLGLRKPEIYSYNKLVNYELYRKFQPNEYPVVVTNWDNTPRSRINGKVLVNHKPQLYQKWLSYAVSVVKERRKEERIVFLKSWNEWAEGNYLEPDRNTKRVLLEITKKEVYK